jgi:hypothetical protein
MNFRTGVLTMERRDGSMFLYFLKEAACCVLLAAALVVLIGAGVLAWKATGTLVGGIRHAHARLAQGRLSEVFLSSNRHAILTFSPVLQSARTAGEPELASKTV